MGSIPHTNAFPSEPKLVPDEVNEVHVDILDGLDAIPNIGRYSVSRAYKTPMAVSQSPHSSDLTNSVSLVPHLNYPQTGFASHDS
jgi:hypothetical protein